MTFDILFADPDVTNPTSEQAFDRYVAASRRSFYAAARLNPKNDAASRSVFGATMVSVEETD